MQKTKSRAIAWMAGAAAVVAAGAMFTVAGHAQTKEPIKIGFSMAQTGPLGPNGKQALLGMKIWEEEINAKGGLLGRPVKLITYDDQSNPSTVPGIYTKLLDVDKVDLVVSGYATNMIAPAMPIVIQRKKTFISLFALDVNAQFKYPKYFSVLPTGPKTKPSFTEGFFQVAMQQSPKPTTVALTYEDAEFSQNACEGARENAKTFGLKIVYDKSFPFNSPDFSSDRARGTGRQCRSRDCLLLSAQLGRHGARPSRSQLQAEDDRRRHGRPAGHRVQEQARAEAQRHRELRDLGAVGQDDGAGRRLLQDVPGASQGARASIRSAIISAAGAMPISTCLAKRSSRDQEPRRRQDRRLAAQDNTLRPSWATGATARTANGPSRA